MTSCRRIHFSFVKDLRVTDCSCIASFLISNIGKDAHHDDDDDHTTSHAAPHAITGPVDKHVDSLAAYLNQTVMLSLFISLTLRLASPAYDSKLFMASTSTTSATREERDTFGPIQVTDA